MTPSELDRCSVSNMRHDFTTIHLRHAAGQQHHLSTVTGCDISWRRHVFERLRLLVTIHTASGSTRETTRRSFSQWVATRVFFFACFFVFNMKQQQTSRRLKLGCIQIKLARWLPEVGSKKANKKYLYFCISRNMCTTTIDSYFKTFVIKYFFYCWQGIKFFNLINYWKLI